MVKAAAKAAYADNFIEELPDKYESFLGESGIRLSGGQKQRIALARALIRRPRILILDDAFSKLDFETEEKILSNIQDEMKRMVTIIITHRLSTIRKADEIIVIKNGEVIERGTHISLMKDAGYYAKVFKNQFMDRQMETLIQ